REPKDVACGMYDRLWAIEANDHWLRDRFADMRAHGLTTVAYCGGLNSEITLLDGKAVVQFDGNGGLEQGLDAYRDAGFTFPLMWMMSDDLWDWCSKQAPVGSEQFGTLYKQALQSILREVPKRRWPGLIFQPVDEPGSYEQRPIPGFLDRWAVESKLIHDAGGVVEIDHIPFTTEDPRLKDPLARALPFIDIFSQRFSNHNMWFTEDQWWWGNMKEQVGKWGKQLWSYNINDAAFFPELATYRLAFGHFLRREGVKGQLLWDFQDSAESPLNALDGSCTDMMYVYPSIPRAGEPGGPTLMWECMREGRDDYNYVYTLQCLTAEAEKQGRKALAAESRELLARLDASFDDETLRARNRFLECQWAETTTEPDGQRVARGEFNIPNGWRLSDYDEWRTRVAKQIVRLQEGR
ncbi:MAG: hypothetical protein WCP21_22025, partial [Armatimonadota bacterium]